MNVQTITAYSYARVNRADSDDGNFALLSQQQKIRRFAGEKNIFIAAEFQDTTSGIALERPGLSELLNRISVNPVDAVIVVQEDRLSRDMVHLHNLLKQLEQSGVQVISISGTSSSAYIDILKGWLKL